jgi:putative transcriptional regulator
MKTNWRKIMAELKTKLKEYRARFNMKQGELAEMVGVRRETIIRLEKGQYNPSLKLAMDIANVFSATVEDLFVFEEE